MGVLRINYQQMDEIRREKPLGIGKEGSCYRIDNKNIIKLYHSFFRRSELYFSNLKDERIAFPIDIVYYENTKSIVGYTMPFLRGNNLINGFPINLNINTLKYAYVGLRDLINKYKDIYMDDMCLDNIFYNEIKSYFSLIDTSRWYPKKDGYLDSISDVNWILIASLLINIDVNNDIIYEDKLFKELYNLYRRYELEINKKISGMKYDRFNIDGLFIDLLKFLETKTSEIKGYKVKKIEDLKLK